MAKSNITIEQARAMYETYFGFLAPLDKDKEELIKAINKDMEEQAKYKVSGKGGEFQTFNNWYDKLMDVYQKAPTKEQVTDVYLIHKINKALPVLEKLLKELSV